jgi:hypothetical protein
MIIVDFDRHIRNTHTHIHSFSFCAKVNGFCHLVLLLLEMAAAAAEQLLHKTLIEETKAQQCPN